jgi:hypothetical protein
MPPEDNPKDPLGDGPSDEEFAQSLEALHKKIHRACKYVHSNQDVSAQAILMVLTEITQEVASEWWYEELMEMGEDQDPDDEGG